MTSPNQVTASNGTDITFSIDYKVVNWSSSAPIEATPDGWGTADLQYSTDNGANWITAGTIDDSNHSNSNLCTTFSVTILAASVPTSSDLRFQVQNTWAAGNYFFYIDNFIARQNGLLGTDCAAAAAVTPGTITGTTIPTGYNGADMTLTGTDDGVNAAWFAYTATADGTIDVSACGSGIDTDLAIGTGSCGVFTDVIATDDTEGCDDYSSEIIGYEVVTGQVYYIEWSDEWDAGPFDWTLTFTCAATSTFPFEEGFEAATFPPECWSAFRGANGEGTAQDWERSTAESNSGSASAFVRFESVATSAQDWLVTPALDLRTLTNPELSFFARQDFAPEYGTVYTIRVSTTDTNITSFTTVQSYVEDDFSETTFAEYIVNLSAYSSNSTVYIAFVMENNDGDSWYIDDLKVDSAPPVVYTYNGAWSPSNPDAGGSTVNDDIIIQTGDATFTAPVVDANTITVNPGASLTLDDNASLNVASNLTLESVSNSYSSLVLNPGATVIGTGSVNYERHVNLFTGTGGGNDLISAPLSGQTWSNFLTSGTNMDDLLDNGNVAPAGVTYAFAPFDKTATPANYVNYTSSTSTTLTSGEGFRVASDASATVGTNLSFSGTPLKGSVLSPISVSGIGFEEWNLVGNPYASYISAFDFLDHNLSELETTAVAIYGYNGGVSNKWEIINLSSVTAPNADVLITPGQGFFVAASATTSGNVEFTTLGSPTEPDMRRTGNSDDFISGRSGPNYNLELQLSTSVNSFKTDFYFNDSSSLGLNPGYDAKLFGQSAPDFAIYSHLLEDNTGLPMAIQSLGSLHIADISIPLGVNANPGEQLTFTISDSSLPSTVTVYLDDTLENTSTLLNTSDYVLNPIVDLSGTGRFYLRVSNSTLATPENTLDTMRIYTNNTAKTIVITGELLEATTAKVYDIQGRLVNNTTLNSRDTTNRIDVSSLADGVYVVLIESTAGNRTQKVILR
jgi:hypothetical protein